MKLHGKNVVILRTEIQQHFTVPFQIAANQSLTLAYSIVMALFNPVAQSE